VGKWVSGHFDQMPDSAVHSRCDQIAEELTSCLALETWTCFSSVDHEIQYATAESWADCSIAD
jgi:hypothetical protein